MKTWKQLFERHGWLLTEQEENVFSCENETEVNLAFLQDCLIKAEVPFTLERGVLTVPVEVISEEAWLHVLDFRGRGRGESLWFRPGEEEPIVSELDLYIAGVVRQFNRLGFFTMYSCDGHGRRVPHIHFTNQVMLEKMKEILQVVGISDIRVRQRNDGYMVSFPLKREELLAVAEGLSSINKNWIEEGVDLERQLFNVLLEELLNIQGASTGESEIRDAVIGKLRPFVDYLTVDHAGNILAEKTYRSGNGPTILLNAHLDTVLEIEEGRKILKDGAVWTSSAGILGADDRAGVAVLLHLAKHLPQTTFSGKVKFIFTVEEERGLVGARAVNDYFLWGTDAAIVIDRRGNGDIVTSCGGYIPFCHPKYGHFFERTAEGAGLSGWRTTMGGSSDTRIWAEHGIQSVNLSAGYLHEHTEYEELDVEASYQTFQLVLAVFENIRELRRVLNEIKRDGARRHSYVS